MRKDTRIGWMERNWKIGSYPTGYRGGNAFTVPNFYDTEGRDEVPVKVTIEDVTDGWNDVKEKVRDGKVVKDV